MPKLSFESVYILKMAPTLIFPILLPTFDTLYEFLESNQPEKVNFLCIFLRASKSYNDSKFVDVKSTSQTLIYFFPKHNPITLFLFFYEIQRIGLNLT